MAIFISYNHNDYAFVDKLARSLIGNRHFIWLDKWQLTAGESIVEKVQTALSKAQAILVVLSADSVKSNWCKKELNAGLIRELDENKVLLLPLLIEKCEIPLLLREKMYADFTGSFEKGLKEILVALAKVTNAEQGRVSKDSGHYSDYGISWGYFDDKIAYEIVIVSTSVDLPYSILLEIHLYPNKSAAKYLSDDLLNRNKLLADYFVMSFLKKVLHTKDDLMITLSDALPKKLNLEFGTHNHDIGFHCHITARRHGADTGFDNVINITSTIDDLYDHMTSTSTLLSVSDEELIRIINEIDKSGGG